MRAETLRVLLAADDALQCEFPAGFDRAVEMAKVRELIPVLERLTARKFEIDEHVEDASFFTDLSTFDDFPRPRGGTLRLTVLAVRFSSFGGFFTVWSVTEAEGQGTSGLTAAVVDAVIVAVSERGYVYLNVDELDAEYTGNNAELKGISWASRFFDYL